MRLVSCSECFKTTEKKFTTTMSGKIVCHECRHKQSKLLTSAYNFRINKNVINS